MFDGNAKENISAKVNYRRSFTAFTRTVYTRNNEKLRGQRN